MCWRKLGPASTNQGLWQFRRPKGPSPKRGYNYFWHSRGGHGMTCDRRSFLSLIWESTDQLGHNVHLNDLPDARPDSHAANILRSSYPSPSSGLSPGWQIAVADHRRVPYFAGDDRL